jgi:hypothetical protein
MTVLAGCHKEVKLFTDTTGINLKEPEAKQVSTETTPENEYTPF